LGALLGAVFERQVLERYVMKQELIQSALSPGKQRLPAEKLKAMREVSQPPSASVGR
jgi:hypothetical protein